MSYRDKPWVKRLIEAKERLLGTLPKAVWRADGELIPSGHNFTKDDVECAQSWVCCRVGEKVDALTFNERFQTFGLGSDGYIYSKGIHSVDDPEEGDLGRLVYLGRLFYERVRDDDVEGAIAIEERIAKHGTPTLKVEHWVPSEDLMDGHYEVIEYTPYQEG